MDGLRDLPADAIARHRVPGASLAVGRGDTLVEATTGVLDMRTGAPVTGDSVFRVGSGSAPSPNGSARAGVSACRGAAGGTSS